MQRRLSDLEEDLLLRVDGGDYVNTENLENTVLCESITSQSRFLCRLLLLS